MTSLIFKNSSPLYREMLSKSRAEKRTAREAKVSEGGEASIPDDRSVAESTWTWAVVNVDVPDLADPTEDLRVPSSKLPWAISQFNPLLSSLKFNIIWQPLKVAD